jgi:hypothetical protein
MSTELLTTRSNLTVLPKHSRSATRGVGNKKIHRKTFMGGFIANWKSLERDGFLNKIRVLVIKVETIAK